MSKQFNHLNIPSHWQSYWTRFPEGHTILEALIQWVSQVDEMVDNQNKLSDTVSNYGTRLDQFIDQFDGHLSDEVKDTLGEWQQSGFLDVVISEALQWQLDEYISTNEQDKLSLTAQLAQIEQQKINRGEVTVSDIDKNKGKLDQTYMSDEFLQQMAGTTEINAVPADKSITTEKLAFIPVLGKKSKNLFNKQTVIYDFYIDSSDGQGYGAVGYAASDFIEIEPSTDYHKNTWAQFAFYDDNKVYISGQGNDVLTFTTPPNAKYIRLSLHLDRNGTNEVEIGQLELGNVETDYESFDNKIDPKTILDKSIGKEKVAFNVFDSEPSTNLADVSLAVNNRYVDYTTGRLDVAEGFSVIRYVPVKPNTSYIKSFAQQMAFYEQESEDSFISGQASGETFTTPPNCYFVGVTVDNDYLDTYRINEGDTLLPFETYDANISEKNIPVSVLKTSKSPSNIVNIAKQGGDFSKPSEALQSISDSKENPITLQIAPGEYSDSLNGWGRYVSVIGTDREHCVIKNDLNDYYSPPIDAGPNNVYKNLTIHAKANESTKTNEMPAYGVHFDLSGRGLDLDEEKYQGTCLFEDCNLYSDYTHGLGAGLSKKTKLVFRNCDFYSSNESALRIHGYMPAELATEQNAEFINCRMWNNGSFKPIVLQDPNMNNPDTFDTEFNFQNCVAWNDDGQTDLLSLSHTPTTSDDVVGNIKLGKGSFGNNISALNKQ